ncbi:unnamed protein product [Sphagnum balticum]
MHGRANAILFTQRTLYQSFSLALSEASESHADILKNAADKYPKRIGFSTVFHHDPQGVFNHQAHWDAEELLHYQEEQAINFLLKQVVHNAAIAKRI